MLKPKLAAVTASPVPSPGQRLRIQDGFLAQLRGLSRSTVGFHDCGNARSFPYLCPSTETLTSDFTGRKLCDDIAIGISSFSTNARVLGPHKRRHYFSFLNTIVRTGSGLLWWLIGGDLTAPAGRSDSLQGKVTSVRRSSSIYSTVDSGLFIYSIYHLGRKWMELNAIVFIYSWSEFFCYHILCYLMFAQTRQAYCMEGPH